MRLDRVTHSGAQGFEGYLPVDSGTWTVVGAPAGDAGAALTGRVSPYSPVSVQPTGDDIRTTITELRRPSLQLTVEPTTETMQLGTVQDVLVTVQALPGDTGSLSDLVFDAPDIVELGEGFDGPALEVVGIIDGAPTAPFSLEPGATRTFTVQLMAVGEGTASVDAVLTGTDDLGEPVAEAARGDISVTIGGGAEGIPPPEIVHAYVRSSGGHVDGTASGAPGTTVRVSILTSAPRPQDGACSPDLTGDGVERVGSTEVVLDDAGNGTFAIEGILAEGDYAYGIASVGGTASAVSRCALVTGAVPAVSISDADVAEGTNADGTTPLTFRVSLAGPAEGAVSVVARSVDRTATAPDDYLPLDTTLTFLPGETSAQVIVQVVADASAESDESIRVVLSDPVGVTIPVPDSSQLDGEATGDIVDDDGDAGSGMDLRGEWDVKPVSGPSEIAVALTLKSHDQASGRVAGSIRFKSGGRTVTWDVTGRLKGDQLTLTVTDQDGAAGKIAGPVKERAGTLSVVLKTVGRNGVFGDPVRATLVAPR